VNGQRLRETEEISTRVRRQNRQKERVRIPYDER
jgi:hypothetical protein